MFPYIMFYNYIAQSLSVTCVILKSKHFLLDKKFFIFTDVSACYVLEHTVILFSTGINTQNILRFVIEQENSF
jgi:hypothetical protein